MKVIAKVDGLRELEQALRTQLPESVRGAPLRAAVGAGARLVVNAAKALVPVDKGVVKANIRLKMRRSKQKHAYALAEVGVIRGKNVRKTVRDNKRNPGKKVVEYANDPYYWRFIEFGSRKKAPRPFLRPALENNRTEATEKIKERLALNIQKQVAKLRKVR